MMERKVKPIRIVILMAITIVAVAITCLLPPIHQDISYHSFADVRTYLSIPNFLNVITNLPFLFIGIYGFLVLNQTNDKRNLFYAFLFAGITLTGFGSAYYHYHPNNATLVYDRIPMTIIFMSFLSLTIWEYIDSDLGKALLLPLVLTGISSVLWWECTGDLRLYVWVQFYPVLVIPVIYILFPSPKQKAELKYLKWVVAWYAVAKLFEHFDKEVFQFTHFISGHSLKHLAAVISTYYIVLAKKLRNRL